MKWGDVIWEDANHVPGEQRVEILRRHFLDNESVQVICAECDLEPEVFERWAKEMFEDGVWPRDDWDYLLTEIVKSEESEG